MQQSNAIPRFNIPPAFKNNVAYLRFLSYKGLSKKDAKFRTRGIRKQLEDEIDCINQNSWVDYFLILADCVDWVRKQGGIVGPGSGASGSFLICYVLGITEINPRKYSFYKENYLSLFKGEKLLLSIEVGSSTKLALEEYIENNYGNKKIFEIVSVQELDVIRDVQKIIRRKHRKYSKFDITKINEKDSKTFSVFASGDTDHVYGFKSKEIKEILVETKPSLFIELAMLFALNRPGLERERKSYCRYKKQGSIPISSEKKLELFCVVNQLLTLFQEDFIQMVRIYSGCSFEKSEYFTRVFMSYEGDEKYDLIMEELELTMQKFMPDSDAGLTMECIVSITHYLYSKSQAISSALIAYRMAYLKANFPEEFMEFIALFSETH